MRAASPVGVAFGHRRDVDRDHELRAHLARVMDRDRRREAAVDVLALADLHRLEHRRHRARRAHRRAGVAAPEQDAFAAVEVGRGDAERDPHLLDVAPVRLLADELRERLAADQAAARIRPVGEGGLVHAVGDRRQLAPAACPTRTARRPGCRPTCRRRGRARSRSPRAPGSRRCGRSRAPRRRRAPGRCAAGAAAAREAAAQRGGGAAATGGGAGDGAGGGALAQPARPRPPSGGRAARQPTSRRPARVLSLCLIGIPV